MEDIEVISIIKDSIVLDIPVIPPLPKDFLKLRGAQLPNGDLLLCGGIFVGEPLPGACHKFQDWSDEYLIYMNASSQWTKVGTMKNKKFSHSSVLIEDRLHTMGGYCNSKITSRHDQFSFGEGVKEMKEMPIPLINHTATTFGKNKMIVCGGNVSWNGDVS